MANIVGIDVPQNGDGLDGSYITKLSDSLSAIDTHTHASGSGNAVERLHLTATDDTTITTTSGVASIKLASIDNSHTTFGQGLPVGSMVEYVGTAAPTGWLLCHGATVSRTTYATLYSIISTAFGSGDGSTTFHLPDSRGRFLRGKDAGVGRDPNAGIRTASNSGGNTGDSVGTYQQNAILNHSHGLDNFSGDYCAGSGAGAVDTEGGSDYSTSGAKSSILNFSGGNYETRPKNVYFNYIIKY